MQQQQRRHPGANDREELNMCGLIGWSLKTSETMSAKAVEAALTELESRGRDAAGVSGWGHPDGQLYTAKAAIPGSRFPVDPLIPGATGIAHTRAATTGSEKVNYNNHPIMCGHIVGAHNGILWNDRETAHYNGLTLEYEVDSEVLFRAIEHAKGNHDEAARILNELEGDATIVWLDTTTPDTLYVAAMGGRPAEWIKTHDGFYVASTFDAIFAILGVTENEVINSVDWDCGQIPTGEMWTVTEGDVTERRTFAKIGWTKTNVGRVNLSAADGKGGGTVIGKPPVGKDYRPSDYGQLAWSDEDIDWGCGHAGSGRATRKTYDPSATMSELIGVLEDLDNQYLVDLDPYSVWRSVKAVAVSMATADQFDFVAVHTDSSGNNNYFVQPDYHGGWKPTTRRAVEEAAHQMFTDAIDQAYAGAGR